MASTSETGHAKNIAHFQSLISFCTGYGATYNPVKAAIKVTSMKARLQAVQTAVSDLATANTAYQNAVNARFTAFADLRSLATRVINALAVSGATPATLADAKTFNRKIQGKRASTPKEATPPADTPPGTPAKDTVSASQQSYDKLIEHFSNILELLAQEPLYVPNETALQLAALQSFRDNLADLNNAVITAYTPASNKLIARDQLMYAPGTGMVDIGLDAKSYVKALFGSTSPQYKQVNALKFRNIYR
ncbi:MAG TPA: hypothetical protein PLP23_13965 [Panacibacter sp.]|nr:hypothetical protein [Panacibacter sp.]